MEQNLRGGARNGAGRKKMKKEEKRILIGTYHHPKDIELIGGNKVARNIAKSSIERKIKIFKKL